MCNVCVCKDKDRYTVPTYVHLDMKTNVCPHAFQWTRGIPVTMLIQHSPFTLGLQQLSWVDLAKVTVKSPSRQLGVRLQIQRSTKILLPVVPGAFVSQFHCHVSSNQEQLAFHPGFGPHQRRRYVAWQPRVPPVQHKSKDQQIAKQIGTWPGYNIS